VDSAEETILGVASGTLDRDSLLAWVRTHLVRSTG
jgi:hypothetical protein